MPIGLGPSRYTGSPGPSGPPSRGQGPDRRFDEGGAGGRPPFDDVPGPGGSRRFDDVARPGGDRFGGNFDAFPEERGPGGVSGGPGAFNDMGFNDVPPRERCTYCDLSFLDESRLFAFVK